MKKIAYILLLTGMFQMTMMSDIAFGQFNSKNKRTTNIQKKHKNKIAPNFAALGTTAQVQGSNTLSFAFPAGNNCLLLVAASDPNVTDIISVTYNGMALTQAVERTDNFAVDSFWYLTLGTSCSLISPGTIVVSPVSTGNIGAYALYGVDQANPISDTQQANDTSGNSSLNVTSGTGDLVIDLIDNYEDTNPTNFPRTSGMGQTSIFSFENLPAPGGVGSYDSTSKPGGAPTVNMSWTSSNSAMIHLAVNINGIGPTAADVSIGGRIISSKGFGIPYTIVRLTRPDGTTNYVRSNPFGYYKFNKVEAGETYTVSVKSRVRTFEQPTQVITVSENITDLNFIAK